MESVEPHDPVNDITQADDTHILDQPPCCLALVPSDPDHVVVGTYLLKEDTDNDNEDVSQASQAREGSLLVYRVRNGTLAFLPPQSTKISSISTPLAILDIKFRDTNPATTTDLFAAATSTGAITLYTLIRSPEGDEEQLKIRAALTMQVFESSELVTYVTWHASNPSKLHAAGSSGRIVTVDMSDAAFGPAVARGEILTEDLAGVTMEGRHGLEAWVVETAPGGLLSGSDDAELKFLGHDAYWSDARTHGAGVTAIRVLRANPDGSLILLTGSYDDRLRVLHVGGAHRRPKVLAELLLGGGVWRISITPVGPSAWRLLIPCMYAGCFLVALSEQESGWTLVPTTHFTLHESICYAASTLPTGHIISCSFYDKRLCLWTPHTPPRDKQLKP